MKLTDENIIARLELGGMDQEYVGKMLASFYQALDSRLALVIADKLSDEQLQKFNELKGDESDETSVDEWIVSAIPGYEALYDQEAEKLLAEIDAQAKEMI